MSEEEYLPRYAGKEIEKLRVFEVMRYKVDCGQCGQDPTYKTKEFSWNTIRGKGYRSKPSKFPSLVSKLLLFLCMSMWADLDWLVAYGEHF